ncbi:MAG: hypothetical protein DHS20C21_07730 [Gemmatimonadota bacterium]|nr:MAG: hypothetical protein DHS20C21_07730 [Gemmatimonadota bacterium]
MAEFLTTTSVSAKLEQLIMDARKEVFLVSPYVSISPILLERLSDCEGRGVKITIVYGKSEMSESQSRDLERFKNVDVYFHQNLHAKCYYNETQLIVTSLNLYEFSEKTNREMGVLLTEERDAEAFRAAIEEARSIMKSAELRTGKGGAKAWLSRLLGDKGRSRASSDHPTSESSKPKATKSRTRAKARTKAKTKATSCCIRCGEARKYGPDRPLCSDCYAVWALFEDPDYNEHYCHRCGAENETSVAKPLCTRCFRDVGYW